MASGHAAVTAAAAEILTRGGNAFDAAVAAGFASVVAEPALTSLGGGGFLLAHRRSGEPILFDFFVDTPGLGRDPAELEPHFLPVTVCFGGSDQVFHVGRGSSAVPGTLKGLLHVHERLGRLPLRHVVAPAETLARDGVQVTPHQAFMLQILQPILGLSAEGRALFQAGGAPPRAGDRLGNPDLAAFLSGLPGSADSFYRGEVAHRIQADMGKQGLLGIADLGAYRVIERRPLAVDYRGLRLLTNPPPSLGGSLLALSLRLLETQDLSGLEWLSGEHLALVAALQFEIEGLRERALHNPDEIPPEVLEACATRLQTSTGGTTHFCVSDREGNVASMTNSNGEGSGYVVPGTGIMLNNMLGEDDLHPEGFHAAPPGERVASMMSPSLLVAGDRVRLALGSGGSKRIRSALLQVLTHVVDFGRSPGQAVGAPRIHWDGDVLHLEPGFPSAAVETLEAHWNVHRWETLNLYFGGVQALVPDGDGAADPRRGGTAARVS